MIAPVTRKRRMWTEADLRLMREMELRGCSDREIAEALGRRKEDIHSKRYKLRNPDIARGHHRPSLLSSITREPRDYDPERRRHRCEAYNLQAHRVYRESGGEYGWPEHEWQELPSRSDWLVERGEVRE